MEFSSDELAGVVDLFGGLTRAELREALAELAFKRGEEYEPDRFTPTIEAAVETYHLVPVSGGDEESLLVPGPVAFPDQPEGSRDLPHILDIDARDIDRDTASGAAVTRFQDQADAAIEAGDSPQIERLLDVSYELEAWAAVDISETRARLDESLEN